MGIQIATQKNGNGGLRNLRLIPGCSPNLLTSFIVCDKHKTPILDIKGRR